MSESDFSRRDFLKRGAVVGGAAMWMTPVVQTIGMSPAFAQTTSPVEEGACYAVKFTPGADPKDLACEDISNQTSPNGTGQCMDVDATPEHTPISGGCSLASAAGGDDQIVVTLPAGCRFIRGWVKTGEHDGFCFEAGVQSGDTVTFDKRTQAISHIELLFCCDA